MLNSIKILYDIVLLRAYIGFDDVELVSISSVPIFLLNRIIRIGYHRQFDS